MTHSARLPGTAFATACTVLIGTCAALPAASSSTAPSPETAAAHEPQRLSIARIFAAPDLSGAALRQVRFSSDSRQVTWLQGRSDDKDRLDLWAFDIATQRTRRLVDSSALLAAPAARAAPAEASAPAVSSADEAQRRERQRTSFLRGIVDHQFSPNSRQLLLPVDGDLWLYELDAPGGGRARRLTQTPGDEIDPKFSPRGRFVSFVREGNLYVIELATGAEWALSKGGGGTLQYGVAEFVAQEEMDRSSGYWWAPDESRLAYTRVDESAVDELERFEILASSIRVVRQRHPAAGRPNAEVQLWIAPLLPGTPRRANYAPAPDGYLARVDWFPDSRALAVQWQSRDQRRLLLRRVGASDGRAHDLVEERSDSWVPLHDELSFLPERRAFLWASSRCGYRHLYLYDYAGRLLRPVTAGAWMLGGDGGERAIEAVDTRSGRVYFSAGRETPIGRQLYWAPLAGSDDAAATHAGIHRVTTGAGWHSVVMSADARFVLDTFSDPDTPHSLTLRRADGRSVAGLVENRLDASHPYTPFRAAHLPTEFGSLQAADGQTLHYQLIRPRELPPGRRLQVIVDVYGGPGVQRVRRAWDGIHVRQYLAQQGYAVFTVDNRGSGQRGEAFEAALHQRLGNVEVDDQVRGVDYLRTLPSVDPQRIGMFGWNYGGSLALTCLLRAPTHFAAGAWQAFRGDALPGQQTWTAALPADRPSRLCHGAAVLRSHDRAARPHCSAARGLRT